MSDLKHTVMVCPFCECEIWIIGSTWFKCFLCGSVFFNKNILTMKNIPQLNQTLDMLDMLGWEFLKED